MPEYQVFWYSVMIEVDLGIRRVGNRERKTAFLLSTAGHEKEGKKLGVDRI
jgi:hypothetical protein